MAILAAEAAMQAARVLPLPPWCGLSVVWEEERGAILSISHSYELARVAEGIIQLASEG